MKRSSQVALLLMGATGVGASAYAMTPQQNCPPTNPAAVSSPAVPGAPSTGVPGAAERCPPRRSSGSGGYGSYGSGSRWTRTNSDSHWSRPAFSRTTTPTPTRVSTTTTTTTSRPGSTTSTSRGGFGSTGGSHASSGG